MLRYVVQGLENLKNLKILDVSNNRISKVQGLDSQTQLEDLWLNDNGRSRRLMHDSCKLSHDTQTQLEGLWLYGNSGVFIAHQPPT